MSQKTFTEMIEKNTDAHHTIPFWSWNGELEAEELKEQIRQMKAAGIRSVINLDDSVETMEN